MIYFNVLPFYFREDPEFCLELLNAITKINKFDLSLMFLTKKEKARKIKKQ